MSKLTKILVLSILLVVVCLPVQAWGTPYQVPVSGGDGGAAQPAKQLDPILTLKPTAAMVAPQREKYIASLIESIKAIEDVGVKLNDRWRRKIAEAALFAEEQTGVEAVFMLALARMESDFRGLTMINTACKYGSRTTGCYADCGMTQHHVRGDLSYVQRMCKKLVTDPKISFLNSAQEIARHVKWCNEHSNLKHHMPLRRCVLNRYNQGTFYRRKEQCDYDNRCYLIKQDSFQDKAAYDYAYKDCIRRRHKCRARAAYWKKLTCFEYGARNKLRSRRSCRYCTDLSYILTYFYSPPKQNTPFCSVISKLRLP